MTEQSNNTVRKERFLKALTEKLGIVSLACRQAGIDRRVFLDWMKTDPDFAESVRDCDELVLDFTEAKMLEKIGNGDPRLIRFILETKGKNRGYGKQKEISDSPVPFTLLPEEMSMFLPDNTDSDNTDEDNDFESPEDDE